MVNFYILPIHELIFSDIQFWRNRKSLEGLSVRSVIFGVFQSLIVVLYVTDNETNFVVRCSVFVGLGIEVWKIFKVIDISVSVKIMLPVEYTRSYHTVCMERMIIYSQFKQKISILLFA